MIDASAVLHSLASGADIRRWIPRVQLFAPPLLWSEVTSALCGAVWNGSLAATDAGSLLRDFQGTRVRREMPATLYSDAFEIAQTLGWKKTYDAEYIALARLLKCPLLTKDGRLARGAERIVDVIDPASLTIQRPGRGR